MSNWIFVIGMILIGIFCYFIGLTRGIKETEAEHLHDYDKGYMAAIDWCEETVRRETRQGKLKGMIKELDELFEYDENNQKTTNDHA
jgi:hypothetical protein